MLQLRRWLWLAAALLATAVALLATVGVTVDASRWRAQLSERLAGTLGRPVALDGPVHVVVSLSPRLRAERVRLPNPPGFAASNLLSIGELRVHADLWPLLAGKARVRELIARDVNLRLERDARGQGNWSRPLAPALDREAAGGLARLDLHRLVVEGAAIEYGGAGRPRRAEIAELTAEARAGRAARAELKGAAGGSDYVLTLAGAPLSRLGTSESWPWTIDGRFGSARVRGEGRISGPLAQPEAELRFDVDAPDAGALGAALGAPVPPLGAVAASGSLHLAAGRAALRGMRLSAGQSAISGDLALDWSGPRPRLTGALDS
ncbi:MAG TPA: AsmA family protein, partial [Pelomicrobium sp.]|nr:AsmA family protein [Pelomicrobium sp.]